MSVKPATRRFTIQEYYRMLDAGILHEDDRVELIGGEIVTMTPIGPRHSSCVTRLRDLFEPLTGRAIVRVQDPVVLDDDTEPQPDLSIVRWLANGYMRSHPAPRDIYLLVEVGAPSADDDRDNKLPRYAGAGVREVWLVDLEADHLEVHHAPLPSGYTRSKTFRRGDEVSPGAFHDLVLSVDEILGPR